MSQIPKYILNWRDKGGEIPVATSLPESGVLLPNVLYELGVVDDDITVSFAEPVANIANVWCITFDIGATVPTITWTLPEQTIWADGAAPTLEANTHYEINLMDRLILVVSAAIPTITPEP